jgi:hypothetical protein
MRHESPYQQSADGMKGMDMPRTISAAVVVAAVGLLAAGCGSATKAATSATTLTTSAPDVSRSTASTVLSTSAAAQAYLAAVNPVNATLTVLANKAGAWTDQTTDAQAESDAQPAIAAMQGLQQKLLDTNWPTSAEQDVKTVVSDTASLSGDLQGLSSLNFLDESSWVSTFERDGTTLTTAANIVRRDLGLPPSS